MQILREMWTELKESLGLLSRSQPAEEEAKPEASTQMDPDGPAEVVEEQQEVSHEVVSKPKARGSRIKSVFYGTLLYFATLTLEIPGFLARAILVIATFGLCMFAFWCQAFYRAAVNAPAFGPGANIEDYLPDLSLPPLLIGLFVVAITLAGINMVISLLTFFGIYIPLLTGGWFMRLVQGARQPSQREREQVIAALERIAEASEKRIKAPFQWLVVDNPNPNAFVIGGTIYIHSSLIWSDFLTGLLAHELGHLNSTDGQFVLAVNELIMPWKYLTEKPEVRGLYAQGPSDMVTQLVNELRRPEQFMPIRETRYLVGCGFSLFRVLSGIAHGGLGLIVLNPLWVWYWREREYFADNWVAVNCGQDITQELINFLEQYQFFDTATPFFMSDHPSTELRIDALLPYVEVG